MGLTCGGGLATSRTGLACERYLAPVMAINRSETVHRATTHGRLKLCKFGTRLLWALLTGWLLKQQESNAMNNQLSLVEYRALPLRERGKLENWRRMSQADQALFQAEQRRPTAPTSESGDDAAVAASVKRIAKNWFLASGFVTRLKEGRAGALNPVVA